MKTAYRYSVNSAVEITITKVKSLFLDDCEIILKVDKKRFLSGVEIIIPGRITETQGKAHKIAKYLSDVFIVSYGSCDLRKFQVFEISGSDDVEKSPKNNQFIISTYFSCRKAIKSQEELEQQFNFERYNQHSDAISAFSDGFRAVSILEKYVNFFKVVEFVFAPRNGNTKEDLKKELHLRKLIAKYKGVLNKNEDKIIEDLVSIRHKCSHLNLKSKKPIGFTSGQPEQVRQIEMYLPLLEKIGRELLFT